ncbi:MAG: hypothetical protein IPK03_14945 [Bacteroidetes bacterium]|nr:hypothetical protein [Bacteroidota bacterium]
MLSKLKQSTAILVIVVASSLSLLGQTNSNYYQTLSDYTLEVIPTKIGGNVVLGRGLDLSDPSNPRLSTLNAFNISSDKTSLSNNPINESIITQASSYYVENQSEYEKARSLYFNFKIAYGFFNMNAAFSQVQNERNTHRSIQFIMQNTVTAPSIDLQELKWVKEPNSEKITEVNDRKRQFIEEYGTHFIQSINYGFRIAIEGKIQTSDINRQMNFSAAFKAWSAKGSAGGSFSEILKSSDVQLTCVITAGSITPLSSMVLRGFDDISLFLTDLKNGTIKITNAPISCNLNRFTLLSYPNSKEIFKISEDGTIALAPYGVPKGTIISWFPDQSSIIKDQVTGQIKIIAPKGWLICDGSNQTPNLTGRFPRGVVNKDQVGVFGGPDPLNPVHNHDLSYSSNRKGSDKNWGETPWAGGPNPIFDLSSKPGSSLPPYFDVIYLIKQ